MFLEDVFDDKGMLLLSANIAVESDAQVANLKNRGVRSVYINTKRGLDVSGDEVLEDVDSGDAGRAVAYFVELNRAKDVRRDAVKTAVRVLSTIRKGADFTVREVRAAAEDMTASILRNPEALVSLCQIKGYDEYTYEHSVNVAILMTSLSRSFGYEGEELVEIGMGGLLHDIGKMRVPERILNKPGKLTDTEFGIVKRHPEFGIEMLDGKQRVSDLSRKIVYQHHERHNGTGYPLGIRSRQIHEVGLLAGVADVYDALTSDRVYKAAWPPQKALAEIFRGCDKEYSRNIVEEFTRYLGIYPVGSFVKLSSGEMGVVTRVDKENLLAPEVLLLFDKSGRRLAEPQPTNLAQLQAEAGKEKYRIEVSLNPKAFNVNVGEYIRSGIDA